MIFKSPRTAWRRWRIGVAAALLLLVLAWLALAIWPPGLVGVIGPKRAFVTTILNGLTLGGLYFLVASGFTLVFGLMRTVNLAHGSLYLLGAYVGYEVARITGSWLLGVGAGFMSAALLGAVMQVLVFRRMENDELRQTLVTIGISVVMADLMLAAWTGVTYQFDAPDALAGALTTPFISSISASGEAIYIRYPIYRLMVLVAATGMGVALWWALTKTSIGMMIRAGVDDRDMLAASGVNVQWLFALVFALGAGLAGFAGVVGGTALSIAPGEDVRYLLASLVVVIVGGLGSIPGAAIGAMIVGLSEQIGLAYFPTYGVILTFAIMVFVLALRPQGLMGRKTARSVSTELSLSPAPPLPKVPPWSQGLMLLALLIYPLLVNDFLTFQAGAYPLILGVIALSLMVLAGYGGMVSISQLTVAGIAGYGVALYGVNGDSLLSLGLPWWAAVPLAVLTGTVAATVIGAISVRTEGIYTIMITLAVGTATFYFAQQNNSLLNGHTGLAGIKPPTLLGLYLGNATAFYYLALATAVAAYFGVRYASLSRFGLALQAVRDNPRRTAALGFNVARLRVATHAMAGFLAAIGGVLLVWFDGRISSSSMGVDLLFDILIIAVLGGMRHPIGPFLGAMLFVLLKTFAIDLVGGERFNTLIGLVFLAVVFTSRDGLLGLVARFSSRSTPSSQPSAISGADRP